MNIVILTLLASLSNISTIICIKKCKYAVLNGQSMAAWATGIAITILITQFLLRWADIKGASLGLALSIIIVSVMISAVVIDIDSGSGQLMMVSLKQLPTLETVGYSLAVLGVLLVGMSKQVQTHRLPADTSIDVDSCSH